MSFPGGCGRTADSKTLFVRKLRGKLRDAGDWFDVSDAQFWIESVIANILKS